MKQALSFWIGACEHKRKKIRAMQEDVESTGREMTVSEKADVEHLNTTLPTRLEVAKELLHQVTVGTRTQAGI